MKHICFVNIKTFNENIVNFYYKFSSAFYNARFYVFILSMWWLVHCEGEGMFCLLCRVHNTKNKYNKLSTIHQLQA